MKTTNRERIAALEKKLRAARLVVRETNQLFELQHTRSIEADKMWRKAHPGNEHVIPDLGRLLGWMMDEIKKGKKTCK